MLHRSLWNCLATSKRPLISRFLACGLRNSKRLRRPLAKPMQSQCKANAKPMQSQWSNIAACPPPAECEAHVEAHAIMGRGSHDIAYRHLVIHNWIGIWQFAFSIEFLRLEKNRLLCMSWATFSMRSVDGGSLSNDSCSARFVCNGHNRPHGTIWNDRGSTCKRPCEGRTLE